MPTSYDPNAPLIDPDIQAALERGRQAQLAALLSQQQQTAAPRNLGEGIDALGKGLMQGIHNYMAGRTATANNAAMAQALGGQQPMPFLGGPSTMTPMAMAPAAGPPTADAMAMTAPATPMADAGTPVADAGAAAGNVSVSTPTGGGGTRGMRYNNPFDVSLPIAGWEGGGNVVGAQGQSGFASFPDMGTGVAAGAHRISDYIDNKGLNTIAALNSRYATDQNWKNNVASASGLGLHEALDTSNPTQMHQLQRGILKAEGQNPDRVFGVASQATPTSYGVPAGQVAGPGVPSTIEPTTQEGRSAALGVPTPLPRPAMTAAASPPEEEEEEETPTPPAKAGAPLPQPVTPLAPTMGPSNPMLSPQPMGAPQGFAPPGVAPQATAGVSPHPPVAQPPVAPSPPSAVAGGVPPQGVAPPGTHWAHLPGPPLLLPGAEDGGQQQAQPQGGGGLLAQLFGGGAQAAPAIRAPAPAQMAAGLAPQQSGIAAPQGGPVGGGLAAGLAGQQPQMASGIAPQQPPSMGGNQAVYQQMYQAAAGPAQRLQHAAALAAASGNQALAQEYERQATPYVAEMNKANELAVTERTEKPQLFTRNDGSSYLGDPRTGQPVAQISAAKPAERQVTQDEATKLGLPNSSYMINPQTGAVSQITGTADKSDTTAIKEFEYGQAHPEFSRAPKWIPNAKTNDLGQPVGDWVTPPNPADKSGTAQQSPTAGLTDEQKALVGTPNDHPMPAISGGAQPIPTLQLTDEQHAALNSVPDARRSMVQSILQRDMVAPTISAKNPLPAMLRQDVLKVMPNFDFAAQPGQVKSKSEFLSGGPSSYSKQIEFGDTAVNHLLDYTGLSDKVPDSSEGLLSNVIGGPLAQKVGTAASGLTNQGITAQNALINKANTFSGELTKYLTGSEGTEADRNAKAAVLSPSLPVAARKAAVLDLMNTVEGRKSEIQAAWHNAVGPNVQDFPVISQHAQQSMDKIRAWATSGPGAVQIPGGAPQGGMAPTGPAPGAPMPAGPVGASALAATQGAMAAPPRNVAPQVTGSPPAAPAFNYDAIPKGQVYTAPDGKQRRKQ